MAQVARKPKLPGFVPAALKALRQAYPGAVVDAEALPGLRRTYYRLAVMSDRFKPGAYLERQDEVWAVLKGSITEEQRERILMILALRPEEFDGE